ncbi:hypothetical protein RFM99_33115 [Mesorhizobium sp. VK4C]|nr:hypothetical protein [Mesorhizobium sp. VK4C]
MLYLFDLEPDDFRSTRPEIIRLLGMASMLHPDTPAKCCSYCGGRDHDFEECPKRKADAEKEEARVAGVKPPPASEDVSVKS